MIRVILFTLAFIIGTPQFVYKFKHPEKTQTQLTLEFFKAYKEFFEDVYSRMCK